MTFETSAQIDKLAAALAKVQARVSGVERNAANPHFKSRYADLAATNAACRDALTDEGIAVSQWPGPFAGGAIELTTLMSHASGQWMRGTMSVPISKQDAQGYGSALTYARRYALQAVVGLSPEDDDGNAASRGPAPVARVEEARINAAQLKVLQGLVDEVGADLPKLCKYYRVEALPELPAAQFNSARAALEAKRKPATAEAA